MHEPVSLVMVSGPNRETLVRIGRVLVEEKLAACVSVLPEATSIFDWEGAMNVAAESLALIKTTRAAADSVCRRVADLHPYELPECIALDVAGGSPAYLQWVAGSVREGEHDGTA